jgi:glyoxylase-like metal-dependent hydrolase (beta-lactamase superfamily II)
VLYSSHSNKAIILDPGSPDCQVLLDFLNQKSLIPEFVILTHEHFDHIAGVNKLRSIFDIDIIASSKCAERIKDKKKNLSLFFDQTGFEISSIDITIEDIREHFIWQGNKFEFYLTPGHSPGSITTFTNNCIFVGDLIIKEEKTITKLPGGSNIELMKSLTLIYDLAKASDIIYPGHGDVFKLNQRAIKLAIYG